VAGLGVFHGVGLSNWTPSVVWALVTRESAWRLRLGTTCWKVGVGGIVDDGRLVRSSESLSILGREGVVDDGRPLWSCVSLSILGGEMFPLPAITLVN